MLNYHELKFAGSPSAGCEPEINSATNCLSPDGEGIEFVPPDYFAPLQINHLFPQPAPLEVDVGCGEGAFIVAMARLHPNRNFLGIERLVGRIRKVGRRCLRAKVTNVRTLCVESSYSVRYLLPPASVSVFHVMFPDPWPKRKHRERRLINREFLDSVHSGLGAGGELRLTTDDADYFEQIKKVASTHEGFSEKSWVEESGYPQTDFEKRFRALGLPIHRLKLGKI